MDRVQVAPRANRLTGWVGRTRQFLVGVREGQAVEVLKKQAKAGAWEDFRGDEEIVAGAPAGLTDGQAVSVSRKP